jgi:hypothetical protein
MVMDGEATAALKEKLGPLPVYAWLLITTGVGLILWGIGRKKSGTAATTGTPGTPCTMASGAAGTWDSTGTVCQATTVSTTAASSAGATGSMWNYHNRLRPPCTTGGTGTSTAPTTPVTTSSSTGSTVPPSPPPISTGPTPPVGSGSQWAYPAPGGLTAFDVSSTGYHIKWNAVTGPSGQKPSTYTVATYNSSGTLVDQFDSGSLSTLEYGKGGVGLKAGTYHTNVWANGGPLAPQHATVTVKVTK